jgi:hypothetical protein
VARLFLQSRFIIGLGDPAFFAPKDLTLAGLQGDTPFLLLFSKSSFTPRLKEIAAVQELRRLLLISLDEMYRF